MVTFTAEERTAIRKFHDALAERCLETPNEKNCPACDMRLYCYMAPPSVTANQLELVMDYLENRAAVAALVDSLDKASPTACTHRISQTPCEELP